MRAVSLPDDQLQESVMRRVSKLRQTMRERGLEALVIYASPLSLSSHTTTSGNVRYLTGWKNPYVSLSSVLLLPLQGDPVLFVHNPFAKKFAEQQGLWVKDIRAEASSGVLMRRLLDERSPKGARVGLVGVAEMPTSIYEGLMGGVPRPEFQRTDDIMAMQRAIKDELEVQRHRRAAAISDAMLFAGMNLGRASGVPAYMLMLEMENVGRMLGAEYARCWLDAGSDPISKYQPWQIPQPVEQGDRVNAGTYVINDGYWAHGLRMGVKGKPTAAVKHYAELVIGVQDAGIRALRPGRPIREAVQAMQSVIDSDPTVKSWGSLGHGLGLQYEDPLVTDAFPQPFPDSGRSETGTELQAQPGMVLEFHPNFRAQDLGTFYIGDVILLTNDGPEFLTKFPRTLYEI